MRSTKGQQEEEVRPDLGPTAQDRTSRLEDRASSAQREAEVRARQQEVVARLGVSAIVATDLQEVLERAVAIATETLEVGFAKILELETDRETFLLRAGVGWRAGLVGSARVPVIHSQGGYSLRSDGPVIVEDLGLEKEIDAPELLTSHGIISGMTVLILAKDGPWGVFGIHSDVRRTFTLDDVHFLQALANVITAVLERERVEEQLRRSRAELALKVAEERLRRSERLASLGTLAVGIAHEINNPVNTILMTAESAQAEVVAGAALNGRLTEDLEVVIQEAERCGRIVQRVLEFVRDRRPARKPTDLNTVVRSAVTMAQKYAGASGPEIELDLDPALPQAEINRAEIEQALIHLIRNAFEASADRGPATIRVATSVIDEGVRASVHDEGPGIEPEIRARIFDPFFTTRRDKGGTGLGLALAHSIATDHGGTIEVDTEPGSGATFRLELPLESKAP